MDAGLSTVAVGNGEAVIAAVVAEILRRRAPVPCSDVAGAGAGLLGTTVQARLCTISTVRAECAATAPATLPKNLPGKPLLPWEPSTISPAS